MKKKCEISREKEWKGIKFRNCNADVCTWWKYLHDRTIKQWNLGKLN